MSAGGPDHRPRPWENTSWSALRRHTPARVGLGRVGWALPTDRVLEFRSAHARAREAVHARIDVDALAGDLAEVGLGRPVRVTSRAGSRAEYVRRPDLGRLPGDLSAVRFTGDQLGLVVADGLSPNALMVHAAALVGALAAELRDRYTIAPPVVATEARVALGDHIAVAMGVQTLILIIGERPGLSAVESLGIYLTHRAAPGCTDADRNCVSNIHPPDGLAYPQAARVVARLISGARRSGRSGVALKDTGVGEDPPPALRS